MIETRALHNFKKAFFKIFYFLNRHQRQHHNNLPYHRLPPIRHRHLHHVHRQYRLTLPAFRVNLVKPKISIDMNNIAAVAAVVVVTIDIHTRRQQRHHRITPRIHQQIQDIQQIQRHNQMSTISTRIITHTFSRIPLPLLPAMWAAAASTLI
jgi:hypothetical protein